MKQRALEMPRFTNESDEADWWASAAARSFVKRKSAEVGCQRKQAADVGASYRNEEKEQRADRASLARSRSGQARKIAERKGIGYQTLLKMLVHEGLGREARRG